MTIAANISSRLCAAQRIAVAWWWNNWMPPLSD